LPTASVGSSQAPTAAVDKSLSASNTKIQTAPFGTLKHWMGSTHFLTRGLVNVSTEMSLQVLAYNLKRVLSILGMPKTMKAMRLVGA
jgi:hypothetical protein